MEDLEGDLVEGFENRAAKKGIQKAKWVLILDVIKLFRPEIIKPLEGYKSLNHYGIIKNYLTIGWRNLFTNEKDILFGTVNKSIKAATSSPVDTIRNE